MRIGIPTEAKPDEFRVAITAAGAYELSSRGHEVLVQAGAGQGSGIADRDYAATGATLVGDASDVWGGADLVVKVKEPIESEYGYLRPGLTLLAYLHLAACSGLTDAFIRFGCTAIAYETMTDVHGHLPLLAPMSEIAGRMGAQVGAHYLERPHGGRGILMGGVPGVAPARVLVVGAGSVGQNTARIAAGMGADTTVLDVDPDRLRAVDRESRGRIRTLASTRLTLAECVTSSDLVIGAVLLAGARTPRLVTTSMLDTMPDGAVFVDISVDQGGCAETSRPTTHASPTYVEHGVLHYCVANMPGAVPRTSTYALTQVTLPVIVRLADLGVERALLADPHLMAGANVVAGVVTNEAVAEAHHLEAQPTKTVLAGEPV